MKYLRKLWYPIAKSIAHKALTRVNPLVGYPVAVQYMLMEEKYKDEYINGVPMRTIMIALIREQTDKLGKSIKNIMLREKRQNRRDAMPVEKRLKLYSRYRRFCSHYQEKREKEYDDYNFKLAEEAFEKKLKEMKSS